MCSCLLTDVERRLSSRRIFVDVRQAQRMKSRASNATQQLSEYEYIVGRMNAHVIGHDIRRIADLGGKVFAVFGAISGVVE